MANLYWAGEKVKKDELSDHLMKQASKHLPPGTYGVMFADGTAELWIETLNPGEGSESYWYILNGQSKILGWRVIIMQCSFSFIGAGIKDFFAYDKIPQSTTGSCKSV